MGDVETDLEHTARLQECLFAVFDILATPEPLSAQLARIHDQLYTVLDASNLYVAIFDDSSGLYLFPYNADEDDADTAPQRLENSLTDYVRRTATPLLCDRRTHRELAEANEVMTVGSPSPVWMGAPLVTAKGVLGAVVVQSYVDPDAYSVRDLRSLTLVARAMAHAVEGAVRRHTVESEHLLRMAAMEESRNEAVAANAAKSTFLAVMSHELRTPLNAILGYAELLEEELEEQGNEYIDDVGQIQKASKHLLKIISDILDLSRIESGQLSLEHELVELEDIVASVVTLTSAAVPESTTLKLRVLPAQLRTDPAKLTQILINLVANAAAHTPTGHITLRARVSDGQLLAEVADTGSGIAPDQLPRLFRPFEQGDGSTTRRRDGTGLGLAICRGYARLLGGDCTAASVPGMGSTFTVSIPVS